MTHDINRFLINFIFLFFFFFVQETLGTFPKLEQMEAWEELGSGAPEEGSTTDCDDEDGCQASGDGEDKTCKYIYVHKHTHLYSSISFILFALITSPNSI